MSADPAMGEYVTADRDNALAGGVFTPLNLQTYHYAGNNPLKYTDPSGNSVEIKNNGNGSINITFGIPDINSPLPASKPPATFRSGADPIQTSDPDFEVPVGILQLLLHYKP